MLQKDRTPVQNQRQSFF